MLPVRIAAPQSTARGKSPRGRITSTIKNAM
jgi:hypothetical protein